MTLVPGSHTDSWLLLELFHTVLSYGAFPSPGLDSMVKILIQQLLRLSCMLVWAFPHRFSCIALKRQGLFPKNQHFGERNEAK